MILLYLGLHAGAIPLSTAHFGKGNATILVRDFRCTGREESLHQCIPRNYSISSYYSYGYNVPNRYVHSAQHFLLHMILLVPRPCSAFHCLQYTPFPLIFRLHTGRSWEQGYDLFDTDICRIFVTLFKMHKVKLFV